jgi:hypothetical protein
MHPPRVGGQTKAQALLYGSARSGNNACKKGRGRGESGAIDYAAAAHVRCYVAQVVRGRIGVDAGNVLCATANNDWVLFTRL